MNARQQRQASKVKKVKQTPAKPKIKQLQTPIVEDKNPQLEKLSGIMKGILEYRTDMAEFKRLFNKYPREIISMTAAQG